MVAGAFCVSAIVADCYIGVIWRKMFEDNKISGEGDCERMELGRKQVYMGGKVCRIVGKMWGNRGTRWIRICHQRGTLHADPNTISFWNLLPHSRILFDAPFHSTGIYLHHCRYLGLNLICFRYLYLLAKDQVLPKRWSTAATTKVCKLVLKNKHLQLTILISWKKQIPPYCRWTKCS